MASETLKLEAGLLHGYESVGPALGTGFQWLERSSYLRVSRLIPIKTDLSRRDSKVISFVPVWTDIFYGLLLNVC